MEKKSCDYNSCADDATKHVHFNHRYEGSDVAEDGIGLTYPGYFDVSHFCDEHLNLESSKLKDLAVYEIGMCPKDCNSLTTVL